MGEVMPIDRAVVISTGNIDIDHVDHGRYEYFKRLIVPRQGNQCTVAVMEIPPGKTAYPYHWHAGVTEVFYILEGVGVLRTVEGELQVKPGDTVVCPAGPAGAHQLHNPSASETLRYVDFDTTSPVDAPFYPDSDKFSVIIDGDTTGPFRLASEVDYYDQEPDV